MYAPEVFDIMFHASTFFYIFAMVVQEVPSSFNFLCNSLIVSSVILTDMDSVCLVNPKYSILFTGPSLFSAPIGSPNL
jgi:hypothetical protein